MSPGFIERFIVRLVVGTGAFFAAVALVPDIYSENWEVTLFLALSYALAMIFLTPILSMIGNVMSLVVLIPLTVALNLLFLYAADALAEQLDLDFTIDKVYWTALGAFIISAVTLVATAIFRPLVRDL
ncbi:MAG: hypothetical protein FJZ95_04385 [Chloroflexi bacterium]|nr:hypothetical protein [Chloroflexota bacterium]